MQKKLKGVKYIKNLRKINKIMKFRINEKYYRHIIFFLIGLIVVLSILMEINLFNQSEKQKVNYYNNLSPEEKFLELKKNYKNFKRITGKDFLILWHRMYGNYQYKLNGNPVYLKTDCTISIFDFYINLGANLKRSNAGEIKEILSQKSKKREKARDVKIGDILIFRKKGDIGHAACVYKIWKNRIYYCDVNARDNGAGYDWIEFNKLESVYELSFSFWCGDIFKNIIK